MTEKQLTDLLRAEYLAVGMTQAETARRAGLSLHAVHTFTYGKTNASLHTIIGIAKAIGYELKLVKNGSLETRQIVVRPTMHNPPLTYVRTVRAENEYACLKCGRDAGVVEVAGHTQCAHCGHILVDCCGD